MSSWPQGHCESSLGLFDECRTAHKRPPTLRPSHLSWAVSPPVGCYCLQPPSPFIMVHPLVGGIKRWCCLPSVWRLSVVYIGPKSRTERPRQTKISTEVAHVTRNSDTTFKVKRTMVKVTGGRAYCGSLPPTACYYYSARKLILIYHPMEGRRLSWPRHCRKACAQSQRILQHTTAHGAIRSQDLVHCSQACLPLEHCDLHEDRLN